MDVTQNYKESTLVDRDENAIRFLREKFKNEPIEIIHNDFYNAVLQEIECGNTYDMVLMDFECLPAARRSSARVFFCERWSA